MPTTKTTAPPFDPETLATWTTGALVLYIARYAAGRADVGQEDAVLAAAELNARVPPRVSRT